MSSVLIADLTVGAGSDVVMAALLSRKHVVHKRRWFGYAKASFGDAHGPEEEGAHRAVAEYAF
jgi:hypothetical protein